LFGADRGFFSEMNVTLCEQVGVAVVLIPQRGGKRTSEREAYQKSAAFKQGQRFRAGIEGRISVNDGPSARGRDSSRTPRRRTVFDARSATPDENAGLNWMSDDRPSVDDAKAT
jgi:hypothetical protein